jgi:hypothetical protein
MSAKTFSEMFKEIYGDAVTNMIFLDWRWFYRDTILGEIKSVIVSDNPDSIEKVIINKEKQRIY